MCWAAAGRRRRVRCGDAASGLTLALILQASGARAIALRDCTCARTEARLSICVLLLHAAAPTRSPQPAAAPGRAASMSAAVAVTAAAGCASAAACRRPAAAPAAADLPRPRRRLALRVAAAASSGTAAAGVAASLEVLREACRTKQVGRSSSGRRQRQLAYSIQPYINRC